MGPPAPARLVAMFIWVDKGMPAGNSSGSRGSCRLQGKVLPFAVATQAPLADVAIGTASGSVTPVLVECRCLKALMLTSVSRSWIATISAPGSEPREVSGLQVTVWTVV